MKVKHGNTKHGDTNTKLFFVWNNMRGRCLFKTHPAYKRYGKRGIKLCSEWKYDYINFKSWAYKNGYIEGLYLDRRDNDGDYKPSNCRFVTLAESNRNLSTTKLNWDKVAEIRRLYSSGDYLQKQLGNMFSVNTQQISRIITNKRWVI